MGLVLVVEDDPEQLAMRGLLIESAGHQVVEARSAAEAVAQMGALAPGVVVMDLRLPKAEDGVALIRRLGSRARVIVLTGSSLSSVEGLPVFRAFQKPCRTPALLAAIQEAAALDGNCS